MSRPQPRIESKVIHYTRDGSGRDNYIWKINGGLFREKTEDPKNFERGTFGKKRQYYLPNPTLPAKPIHYHANGTGRDTYINVNEGGLSTTNWLSGNFIKDLRGYSPIKQVKQNDYLARNQIYRPKTAQKLNNSLHQVQTKTIERLSQPKESKDPYKQIRASSAIRGLRNIY